MRSVSPVRAYRPCEAAPRPAIERGARGPFGVLRPKVPDKIPGSQWQAGVTSDSDRYRVLLDGSPVPLAFAASSDGGWVMRFLEPLEIGPEAHRVPADPLAALAIGVAAAFIVVRGTVQIVRGD